MNHCQGPGNEWRASWVTRVCHSFLVFSQDDPNLTGPWGGQLPSLAGIRQRLNIFKCTMGMDQPCPDM